MSKKENHRILVVAAHPDDEILGCGGTTARLVKNGFSVSTLILGEGVTSRDEDRRVSLRKIELTRLKRQALAANKKVGVERVIFCDLPDNRFDTIPLLDIIKKVEKVKNKIRPSIIFTHCRNDLNIDHKIAYRSVITAARPMKDETVKTIYSFESASSTEWSYPLSFSPNVFFDISGTINKKIEALRIY